MTDNITKIRDNFLTFTDPGDFYYLQVIQRKKENPDLGRNSYIVKNYFIYSVEQYDKTIPEIIKLCEMFSARAAFWINVRNSYDVAFNSVEAMLKVIKSNQTDYSHRIYTSTVGRASTPKERKKWIIDIDEFDNDKYNMNLPIQLKSILPVGNKLIDIIPSKNGYHYVTKPFNLQAFSLLYPEVEVHKDNFTNLYIP